MGSAGKREKREIEEEKGEARFCVAIRVIRSEILGFMDH